MDLTGQDSTSIYSGTCTDADSRSGRSRTSRGNGDDRSQVHVVSISNRTPERAIGVKEFFQLTMNNGVQDGVVCFKLLVLGMLLIAGLVIGNVAFVYTTSEVLDDYHSDVSLSTVALFRDSAYLFSLFLCNPNTLILLYLVKPPHAHTNSGMKLPTRL